MAYKAPKGTQDLLPAQARAWEAFKAKALQVFGLYGYEPVETPIFEKAELFLRGCGETCDAATKEIVGELSGTAGTAEVEVTASITSDGSGTTLSYSRTIIIIRQ